MRFVCDNQRRPERVEPSDVGLHGCHLHGKGSVRSAAGSDDAVIDAKSPERPAGLIDKLLPVDEDDDAVAFGRRALRDVAEQHRLAGSCRSDDERRPLPGSVGSANAID